jgi:hypothetical protein
MAGRTGITKNLGHAHGRHTDITATPLIRVPLRDARELPSHAAARPTGRLTRPRPPWSGTPLSYIIATFIGAAPAY